MCAEWTASYSHEQPAHSTCVSVLCAPPYCAAASHPPSCTSSAPPTSLQVPAASDTAVVERCRPIYRHVEKYIHGFDRRIEGWIAYWALRVRTGPSRAITLTLAKQARPQRCAPTTRLDARVARPCAGAAHCCHGWGGGPRGADRQLGGGGLVGTELVATLTFNTVFYQGEAGGAHKK